jgi:hypothetical protein
MKMKINVNDFWEEIGTVFQNPEDIKATEYNKYDDTTSEFMLLPKGTYLIVDKDSHGYNLYDIDKGKNVFFEAGWLDEDDPIEFEVLHIEPKEVIKLAIESFTKKIMTLTADGWEINPDNEYFDLTPEIRKLATLQETLKILEMNE